MVATVERIRGRDLILVLGGVLLMADALGLDLAVSLDLAMGVPYALVVLLGLWWPGRGYIYTAAIAGSVLCLAGFYFSFPGGEWVTAATNRGFALLTIWLVAVLCLFQKRTQNKKQELHQLIHHMGQVHSGEKIPREEQHLFKNILDSLLSFTQSRFGVIGEVFENEEKRLLFQKQAGVAWHSFREESRELSREQPPLPSELDDYNVEPLFDEVVQSGKPLLVKYVSPAVSKHPLPAGHRPMESFMGLPFYHEGRMLGVVGVANRAGGYDSTWVETLKPFLAACGSRIHLLNVEREKRETENALLEMERNVGLLQSDIEGKDVRLDQVEKELREMEETLKKSEKRIASLVEERERGDEELNPLKESLNRVQGELEKTQEALLKKEAEFAKSETYRNQTADALWEKEERLMAVLGDFNELEKDLSEKNERIAEIEEDLLRSRDQLRTKGHRLEEMETRLQETLDELQNTQRHTAQVEDQMFQMEKSSQEKDQRLRQMDLVKTDLESHLRDYELRLSRVEKELDRTRKTLRDREGHLERIGREIQETLTQKETDYLPIETAETGPVPVEPAPQDFQYEKDPPPKEPDINDAPSVQEKDLISHAAGQGVFGLDMQGNITFINHEGADLLGYASQELIGKNQHNAMHHSRVDGRPYPQKECHICNTLVEGVVSHVVDEVFWRKDGSHFSVEFLSTPIWKNNQQVGAVVTFTDASRRNGDEKEQKVFRIDFETQDDEPPKVQKENKERRDTEFNERNQTTESPRLQMGGMESGNQEFREFASIASHDLQEPLRKIIGFGSRLQKDCAPALDDRGKDYLTRMEKAAHHMQKFIEDLLHYSKVTLFSIPLRPVDLKEVVADVLALFEERIDETQAVIDVGALPTLKADATQMHQLFQNLISNALKFHKHGESPAISVSHRIQENGWHEIRVADQGIGFDVRHLKRIFKPFERLHGKMEYEGTGMGLAICQKIVHRHGGEITATSSPQNGSTFIITLPDQ
ncbi:MAG: hypothetical protein NPINA01_16020 [Nitrospinaceae bacterium]|nr:MAG: hypothetical protein NPINA01_16020 [Nitrospinaceae bacterium]